MQILKEIMRFVSNKNIMNLYNDPNQQLPTKVYTLEAAKILDYLLKDEIDKYNEVV